MRFRPGGLVVGPGRATRRGYQRPTGPPQSTGGRRTPGDGAGSRVRLPGSCPGQCSPAAATCWPTRSAPAAWARSGAPGTATNAAGSRPSWLAPTTPTTPTAPTAPTRPPPSNGSPASGLFGCGTATSCSRRAATACSPWTWCAAAPSSSCWRGTVRCPTATCGWCWTRCSRRWWRCTRRGWCTATSSRATSSSSPPAPAGRGSASATSASRSRAASPASPEHPAGWAPAATCLPSRLRAPHPTRGRTCYAAGVVASQLLSARPPGGPAPDTPLGRLLASFTHPDPGRRPATAATALDLLRALGVPAGGALAGRPRPTGRAGAVRRPAGADAVRRGAVGAVFAAAGLVGGLASWVLYR